MPNAIHYSSGDTGAPVLSPSVAGSLLAVLDCLVNGLAGKPSCGWTKPFTSGNVAAYRQGGGEQRFLRVDDSVTGSNAYAAVRGYESMSSASAGSDPFPTLVQAADAVTPWYRSSASAVPLGWDLIGDDRGFYLHVRYSTTAGLLYFFGDTSTLDPGDSFSCLLVHANTTPTGSSNAGFGMVNSISSIGLRQHACRSWDAASKAQPIGLHTDFAKSGASSTLGSAAMAFPNTPDGGAYFSPVWHHESVNSSRYVRGVLPGLWNPLNASPDYVHGAIIAPTTGPLAGRSLLYIDRTSGTSSSGCVIEVGRDWRA